MKQLTLTAILLILSSSLYSGSLGSMKIISILGESFDAEISALNLEAEQIESIEIINSKDNFSKGQETLNAANLSAKATERSGKTLIRIYSQAESVLQYFDFNLKIKTSQGNIQRRYFGIIPTEIKAQPIKLTKGSANKGYVVQDLGSCLLIEDANKRLRCFDKSLGKETKTSIVTQNKANELSQEEVEDRYFGKKGRDLEASIEKSVERTIPEQMGAVILKVRKYNTDRYYLDLENNQTWKIIEPSKRSEFKKGKRVSIEKGRMGTFTVSIEGLNRKYKAKRIK